MARTSLLLLMLAAAPVWAQSSSLSLSGCGSPAGFGKVLRDQLSGPAFDKLTFSEQVTLRRRVLTDLAAQYPREMVPQRRLIADVRRDEDSLHAGSWALFQVQEREQAKQHPDDPQVLDLAGYALTGTDTPQSIAWLEAAKKKAPQFVWPDLDLAEIYSHGKFADKAKFEEHLTAYWTACPASNDSYAQWMLVKDMALQAKVAAALRQKLEKETDPDELKEFTFLWSLEFRTHPPQEHAAVRQQVAEDVKRLETIEAHPDAAWLNLLVDGTKQSGAPREAVHAAEDRLIQQYPQSREAETIAGTRWSDAHPAPTDPKDTAAWAAYNKAFREEMEKSIREYPDDMYLAETEIFYYDFADDTLTQEEGVADVKAFLAADARHDPAGWMWTKYVAADYLLSHKWEPERAIGLLRQAQEMETKYEADSAKRDDRSADEQKDEDEKNQQMDRMLRSHLIEAAMLARRPDAVLPLQASIEGPVPEDKKLVSDYWLNRARFAAVQGRKQDALTYYQEALATRMEAPSWQEGKLTDDVMDESRALWKEMGGTETAFAVWSKPAASAAAAAEEARWEKATKTLPDFQLSDLSGKTWTLATLKGKAVLIDLWATWCGPCNLELPHLEKLYEQVKGRQDIQILTFNIDEDVGLVAPFMKEKGYTFPVLPAYSYTVNLLNGYAIPQNWLLDPGGSWKWTQVGFGSADGWSQDVIAKLEAAKGGS